MANPHGSNQPSHSQTQMTEAHAQQMATMVGSGMDWNNLWQILQKLSPALQQIIQILIQQNQNVPQTALGTGPGHIQQVTMNEAAPAAAMYGLDPTALLNVLQQLTPFIAQLLLQFLQNNQLKTACENK